MPKLRRSGYVRITSVEPCDVEDRAGRRAAMTWDLSVLGLYLAIDPIPEVDERIRLSFRLPEDPEPIRAEGRVAWQNPPSRVKGAGAKTAALPPGCGVEFLTLDSMDRFRIDEHVRITVGRRSP